ncbi:MAG: APC family permease [Candidatus Omnitrophota bacterium]|nr:APC family permease [Candidatus Omnitrophota bacterium]
MEPKASSLSQRIKKLVIGKSRNPQDSRIFHKLSLIAFFAWIGLGADGLSSSCYGPQEAFLALNGHIYLSVFVALGTVITIFIITASYSQIVELFPHGGGGYLVASKLLSPGVGMVSGCALLIDYVLTIAVSIASGADAIFSLLPIEWHAYRLEFAIFILLALMILNMRGVKESILILMPIFLVFILTHVFIIGYALFTHAPAFSAVINSTKLDLKDTVSQLGVFGMLFLIMRAYSMGAGTYTGIEAVSNSIPVLREPKAQTAKHTMRYMAISLAFVAMGLMLAYIFYNAKLEPGKTLNAILFQSATQTWSGQQAYTFILIALISEAALLFVAAQTGFIGGPGVLANMATDRWFPTRFSMLSDRLVTQNGILIMSGLALALMLLAQGSVRFLIVLYSINVFITFILSQFGMVRHWWEYRKKVKDWLKKLCVNGVGLILTSFILISMLVVKFNEGGWLTLLITGTLVILALLVKRHYRATQVLLHRLNSLVAAVETSDQNILPGAQREIKTEPVFNPEAKTAVLMVNGFNGMGLHTLFGILRLFGASFKNFIFLQVGVVDAGNFKGAQEVEHLETSVEKSIASYVDFMKKQGYYAEGIYALGVDVVEEVTKISPRILERFPGAVFFGGQLIFPKDSFMLRLLHNYTVFTLQKRLYREGIPFVILPIRV